MNADRELDTRLRQLGGETDYSMPDGFMSSVWERVGQLGSKRQLRHRTALFAGLIIVGFGTGIGTRQLPAVSDETTYSVAAYADLSPSSLLHVGK